MFFPLRDDNPRRSTPWVTLSLIAINVAVQVYQWTMSPAFRRVFVAAVGAIPAEIVTLTDIVRWPDHPQAWVPIPLTIVSSTFVHGGLLHLLGNMWYLWLFGDNVEDTLGHVRFAVFYLLCGVLAAGCQVVASPHSLIPMIGASGAVAGVLGAYALRFPRARVHTVVVLIIFVQFIELPALVVLGFWFVIQVVNTLSPQGELGGVAWFAHVGGFVAGLGLMALFKPRRPRRIR